VNNDRLGLGVIGCGVIANLMYLPLVNRKIHGCMVELAAVSDNVAEKAAAAAQAFDARACYSDYRDLLAVPGVEAVLITTNIASHAEIALAAAAAGKHVLVQKPLAETTAEADAVIAEAQRAGVKLQVEPSHMLSPLCARARDVIASGALGTISSVEARATHSGADDRPWLFTRAGGGSVMLDMGVHALTWAASLAGPVGRVAAFTRTTVPTRTINGQAHDVDIDDNVALLLEFESGALGNIVANYTTIADQAPQYSVYGTEGTIHVGAPGSPFQLYVHKEQYGGSQGWLSPTLFRGHKARPVTETTPYEAHGVQPDTSLGHFVECILEDREPVPGGEFARHVLEIMVKGAEAGRTGVAQQISSTFKPLAG